jgi:hypothetical protein
LKRRGAAASRRIAGSPHAGWTENTGAEHHIFGAYSRFRPSKPVNRIILINCKVFHFNPVQRP